jgi:hypothetical protein
VITVRAVPTACDPNIRFSLGVLHFPIA